MAQFRGTVKGARGEASRLGHKGTGLQVEAQSWQGKIVTRLWYDEETGQDMCEVVARGHGGYYRPAATLYRGPVMDAGMDDNAHLYDKHGNLKAG